MFAHESAQICQFPQMPIVVVIIKVIKPCSVNNFKVESIIFL